MLNSVAKFIVFEGGEGTGKTTQIRVLEAFLQKRGFDVLVTWEPGGTPLGEKIRELLLSPSSSPMSFRCEALLYAAARAQHAELIIKPALENGKIVLCDRYIDASRAYQGVGRLLGAKKIQDISLWATDFLLPDRTYLFDAPPQEGLKRALERSQGRADRIEQEPLNFHERIREAYIEFAKNDPILYRIIDVRRSIADISAEIEKDISHCISLS